MITSTSPRDAREGARVGLCASAPDAPAGACGASEGVCNTPVQRRGPHGPAPLKLVPPLESPAPAAIRGPVLDPARLYTGVGTEIAEPVQFYALRGAVDGMTLLYRADVTKARWDALVAMAEARGGELVGGYPVVVRYGKHRGTLSVRAPSLFLLVRDPCRVSEARTGEGLNGSEMQIKGEACSASLTGLEAVREARAAIEPWLFGEKRCAKAGPRGLRARTLLGSFDVAADVAVLGPGAEAWINDVFFHGDSITETRAQYSTHAHKKKLHRTERDAQDDADDAESSFHGDPTKGRTIYIGRKFKVYEKDKHTRGTLALVRGTWAAGGGYDLDAPPRVMRAEARFDREWQRSQQVQVGDRWCRVDQTPADDLLPELHHLTAAAFHRHRHTCGDRAIRAKDRPSSPFQRAAEHCVRRLVNSGTSADYHRVRYLRRDALVGTAKVRASMAFADLEACYPREPLGRIVGMAVRFHVAAENAKKRELRKKRQTQRLGIELDEDAAGPIELCG